MRYIMSITFVVLFVITAFNAVNADDDKAREIMQKVEDRDDGDNSTSDMQMVLIDKNENQRVRDIRSFRKDKGEDTQSIMFFLSPPDVEGTGFLTYDYDDPDKDDDQWLYLPALKKTKRIATNDKASSFMGSDFNYSDMTSKDIEDYNYTLMKETEVDGHKAWQIKTVPRNDDVIEESGYTQSIIFVRQDNYVVIRAVHWVDGKDGRLKYQDVSKLELIDGIWTVLEMSMTTKENKQTIHKTVIINSNVKYNQDLDENMFTVRQLEKGL